MQVTECPCSWTGGQLAASWTPPAVAITCIELNTPGLSSDSVHYLQSQLFVVQKFHSALECNDCDTYVASEAEVVVLGGPDIHVDTGSVINMTCR